MKFSVLLLLLCVVGSLGQYQLAAYFANWAQYHAAPYGPYTPKNLQGVIGDLDTLLYAFASFDPSTEQMKTVEPKDPEFIKEINAMKGKTKLLISVGGWNFDSSSFSKMASTNETRAAFIRGATSFMQQNQFGSTL